MIHRKLNWMLEGKWMFERTLFVLVVCATLLMQRVVADETVAEEAAERGYRLLLETPLLTNDFHQETFDDVWKSWPEPLRSRAKDVSAQQRRQMAFQRYGLTTRPGDDSGKPMQYVVDAEGNWTMSCLACHGGSVDGTPLPGAPNNRFALQTLTEEIRATKFKKGKPLSRMDLGAMFIPLGTTHGTTNAVVFGVGLMSHRDERLNLTAGKPKSLVHHDLDAPPWWVFYKRPYLYIDGFAQKGHRGLMQFTLIPEHGASYYPEHEEEFRDLYAYLSSLRAPKFRGGIDVKLAEQGRAVFAQVCAECHGTYGEGWTYPNHRVPIEELGTDPVRLSALSVAGRAKYARSWFAHAGEENEHTTVTNPDGYVAPPLDGIWASAPYFHNGSVPTLWHVLHPGQRPVVWHRIGDALDTEKVGLQIQEVAKVPLADPDVAVRRSYFDTRRFGKSRFGHDYPASLREDEKVAVLEYLKTL